MICEILTNDVNYYDRRTLEADGITAIYYGDELKENSIDWCVQVEGTGDTDFYEAWDSDTVSLTSAILINDLVREDLGEELDEDEDVYGCLIRYMKGV